MRKPRRKPVVITVRKALKFCAIYTLVVACVFVLGLIKIKQRSDNLNWPSVKGEVVSSQTKWQRGRKSKVTYTYNVDGQSFKDSCSEKGLITKSGRKFWEKYSVGSTVEVFYNPDNPATSVLEQGIFPQDKTAIVGCFVFMMFGVGAILFVLIGSRIQRRNRATDGG
jgi:hypothetical protein